MKRSLTLALILGLAACGGADEAVGPADAALVDATVPDALPDPWSGNCSSSQFALESITCWSADQTTSQSLDAFVAAAPASRMHHEAQPDDSCAIVLRFEGPDCAEEQRWTETGQYDERGRAVVTSSGISTCAPAACGFGSGDDACVVGDHAGTALLFASVVLDAGDTYLEFEGSSGICADAGFPIESQFWRVLGR